MRQALAVALQHTASPAAHAAPVAPFVASQIPALLAGRRARQAAPTPPRRRAAPPPPGVEPGVSGIELRFQQNRQFARGGAFVPYAGVSPGTEANVALAAPRIEHLVDAELRGEHERDEAQREVASYAPGHYPWETPAIQARGRRMLLEAQRAPAGAPRMTMSNGG